MANFDMDPWSITKVCLANKQIWLKPDYEKDWNGYWWTKMIRKKDGQLWLGCISKVCVANKQTKIMQNRCLRWDEEADRRGVVSLWKDLARGTFSSHFSHHDDDVVECSWHESVQESLLTFSKNCIVPFSKIKKCCFPFWGKRGTPPLLPLYHQNKLWYRLTISRLVLQLLCPFLLLMVQILVAKMICQHCIARMVIAWWFFWTIYTFSHLLYEWLRIFMFAAKIVFSFDFANFLVCTTYNECHGVQNQTIIGTFFCSFGFCPNSLPPHSGRI